MSEISQEISHPSDINKDFISLRILSSIYMHCKSVHWNANITSAKEKMVDCCPSISYILYIVYHITNICNSLSKDTLQIDSILFYAIRFNSIQFDSIALDYLAIESIRYWENAVIGQLLPIRNATKMAVV